MRHRDIHLTRPAASFVFMSFCRRLATPYRLRGTEMIWRPSHGHKLKTSAAAATRRAHVGPFGLDAICLSTAVTAPYVFSPHGERSPIVERRSSRENAGDVTQKRQAQRWPVHNRGLYTSFAANGGRQRRYQKFPASMGGARWITTRSGPSSRKSEPKALTRLRPPKALRLLRAAGSVMPPAAWAAYPLHQHTIRQAL